MAQEQQENIDSNLKLTLNRKRVYVDIDGVLADFDGSREKYLKEHPETKFEEVENIEGFFENLEMVNGAFEAFHKLRLKYDVYILSTAPWKNPSAWSDKRRWVERKLKDGAYKRLILTHNKGLLKGDYLIDDREKNGVGFFEGEHIHFGSEKFPDWETVLDYLL